MIGVGFARLHWLCSSCVFACENVLRLNTSSKRRGSPATMKGVEAQNCLSTCEFLDENIATVLRKKSAT